MGFDYTAAHATAVRLLNHFGQELNLHVVSSTYNPATGGNTVNTVATHACKLVSLPASQGTIQAFDNRVQEALRQGKVRFFIGTDELNGYQPTSGDLLEYEGSIWEVVGSTPFKPADTQVYFTIGVRETQYTELPSA